MSGFFNGLSDADDPYASTNNAAADYDRQSKLNPSGFLGRKKKKNSISVSELPDLTPSDGGDGAAKDAALQTALNGATGSGGASAPPAPNLSSGTGLVNRILTAIKTPEQTGGAPMTPPGTFANSMMPPMGAPQAPSPQGAATAPFTPPGGSSAMMPPMGADRPPGGSPSPFGNQHHGGMTFGGNTFGGGTFGGQQFGPSAPHPAAPQAAPTAASQPSPAAPTSLPLPPGGPSAAPAQSPGIMALIRALMSGGGGQQPQMAHGGFLRMMRGGYPAHLMMGMPERFAHGDYVQPDGQGDGRSDHVSAKLSPGEYVMDAETVGLLGNGDNEAGARRLDEMRENLRMQKGKALAAGKFSPNAKAPETYLPAGGPR